VVKTAPGATASVIAALKKQFALAYPRHVFDFGFVDKDLEALYTSEQQMGSLFNVFSVLATELRRTCFATVLPRS
jgi:hypothetical protein